MGIGQSIHGREILGGNIPAQIAERCIGSAGWSWRSISSRVHLAVQLIELVLSVQRRGLHDELVDRSADRMGRLVDQVVVLVDRKVGRDEDRHGQGRPKLLSQLNATDVPAAYTYLAHMSIGVVQLEPELQLVSHLDPPGVCILEAAGKGLGHFQMARELVPLGGFVDDLHGIVVEFQVMLIIYDGPRNLVCVAHGVGIFRIEGEFVSLDQLGVDLPNAQSLEQGNQSEVHANRRPKNDRLAGRLDRVFNLVGPYIFHRLRSQT